MSWGLLVFAGCSLAFLVGCSDPKGAERVLAANGYALGSSGRGNDTHRHESPRLCSPRRLRRPVRPSKAPFL